MTTTGTPRPETDRHPRRAPSGDVAPTDANCGQSSPGTDDDIRLAETGVYYMALERGGRPFREAIYTYVPKLIDEDDWAAVVGPFTRLIEGLGDCEPPVRKDDFWIIVRYLHWLRAQALWDPETDPVPPMTQVHVEAYGARGVDGFGLASQRRIRSRLRTIGRLQDPAGWAPPPASGSNENAAPPYTPGEIEILWTQAHNERVLRGDVRFEAIIAAGLGAGLRAEEFRYVRGHHVTRDTDGHVTVDIAGPFARQVPVRREWADRLYDAAQALAGDLLVGDVDGERITLVAKTLQRFNTITPVRLTSMRLRNTWTLSLLNDHVPAHLIAIAAGVKNLHTVERMLHLVDPTPLHIADSILRGDPR